MRVTICGFLSLAGTVFSRVMVGRGCRMIVFKSLAGREFIFEKVVDNIEM